MGEDATADSGLETPAACKEGREIGGSPAHVSVPEMGGPAAGSDQDSADVGFGGLGMGWLWPL